MPGDTEPNTLSNHDTMHILYSNIATYHQFLNKTLRIREKMAELKLHPCSVMNNNARDKDTLKHLGFKDLKIALDTTVDTPKL